MANRHLLPCTCGADVAVAASQAGERVACQCGNLLEAPTLRQLRELPVAPEEGAHKRRNAWGLHHAVLSIGLIGAGVLVALAGWLTYWEPAPPQPFDPVARQETVEENLEKITPAQLWETWVNVYEPQSKVGFTKVESVFETRAKEIISVFGVYRFYLLSAAGVVTALAVVGWLLLLPKGRAA